MKYGRINLHIDYEKAGVDMKQVSLGEANPRESGNRSGYEPYLDCYILDDQKVKEPRKAILICPGGGYVYTSEREGEPIAMRYLAAGIQAFVLWYSVKPAVFPMALMELATAMKVIREHAGEWNIDPDQIAVCGFSAGGHLAASLCTMWNKGFLADSLDTSDDMIRPNAGILAYPVITSGEKAHRGSFNVILKGLSEEYMELTSLEKQVDSETPPTFIWSTWNDPVVPIENTLYYMAALKENNVSCEAHIFADGEHGLSTADREVNSDKPLVTPWVKLSVDWFKSL